MQAQRKYDAHLRARSGATNGPQPFMHSEFCAVFDSGKIPADTLESVLKGRDGGEMLDVIRETAGNDAVTRRIPV